MQSTMNKRIDNRIAKILKVKIHARGGYAWAVLQNLSLNGLYIKTNCSLTKDEAIAVELCLPNGNRSYVKGLVKRIEAYPDSNWNFGLGVKLTKKDEYYRNYLHILNEQPKRVNKEIIDSTWSNESSQNKTIRESS